MAAFDTTGAAGVLKEFYQPKVRSQINNKTKLFNEITRTSENIEGSEVVLSLQVTRHAGIGARAEGGALPTAGAAGFTKERVATYNLYGRMSVSGKVIEAAATDRGSFIRAVESQSKTLASDLARDTARQGFGTSDGAIAVCGTTTAATLVVLANSTKSQVRQLEVNMIVDIGTVAAPTTIAAARTITAVDVANKTITISGANISTVAGTHFVFRSGNGGAIGGVGQKEITGLQSIVDSTGTLFQVNPSTYPVWSSYERAVGGQVAESDVETLLMEINIASGEDPDLLIASDGVYRAYANLLKSFKRFPNEQKLKSGYSGISVTAGGGEAMMVWDRDVKSGDLYAITKNRLTLNQMNEWQFMDRDGGSMFRISGEDAYEATMYKYCDFTTDARNAHGKLTGITEA